MSRASRFIPRKATLALLEQPRELEELLTSVLAVVREADLLLEPRPHGIAIDAAAELFLQLA